MGRVNLPYPTWVRLVRAVDKKYVCLGVVGGDHIRFGTPLMFLALCRRVQTFKDTYSFLAVTLDTSSRLLATVWTQSHLPFNSTSLLPVPKPLGESVSQSTSLCGGDHCARATVAGTIDLTHTHTM